MLNWIKKLETVTGKSASGSLIPTALLSSYEQTGRLLSTAPGLGRQKAKQGTRVSACTGDAHAGPLAAWLASFPLMGWGVTPLTQAHSPLPAAHPQFQGLGPPRGMILGHLLYHGVNGGT